MTIRYFSVIIGCCFALLSHGQHGFTGTIRDKSSHEALSGVTVSVEGTNLRSRTNDSGRFVLSGLLPDSMILHFTHVNFKELVTARRSSDTSLVYFMERSPEVMADVTIISTTRTLQRMENAPLKVEVLGKEDMDEENTIRPANIASIIGDISGIQIQQSSAVSGNANVRIQGLEGRYTQLLRDGMPLFEGFSGNFGVLTIPPLDLRQIELLKGSASTLYGGGAIGGLINLISKTPAPAGEYIVTLNQTSRKESDVNAYASRKGKKAGYTLFTGYTRQNATDVNTDGFSDLPHLRTVVLHPRLFFYPSPRTTLITGYTGTFDYRKGGDMRVLRNRADAGHVYYEANRSQRHTAELMAEQRFEKARASLKASLSSFQRNTRTDAYFFRGNEVNYFSELSFLLTPKKTDWVMGVNLSGNHFRKKPSDPIRLPDRSSQTAGLFVQPTFHMAESTTIEAGLRADHHNRYGTFVLPRLALFHRLNDHWAFRFGAGVGYKTPDPLAPQRTEYDIHALLPLSEGIKAERSTGYNAEANYRIKFGEGNSFFINQAFFYTRIRRPLTARVLTMDSIEFYNEAGPVVSQGSDTYIQLQWLGCEIYAGYTYTVAERKYLATQQFIPLTPRNRFAFTLVRELGEDWRMGLEGSFTGRQYRDDGSRTPGYYFMAGMIGRNLGKHISVVLNGENLLDYRQSRTEALYTGSILHPQFVPLWAPIDGRVLNLSVRWKS